MSSVVNKSNIRFAPKVRQRRAAVSSNTSKPVTSTSNNTDVDGNEAYEKDGSTVSKNINDDQTFITDEKRGATGEKTATSSSPCEPQSSIEIQYTQNLKVIGIPGLLNTDSLETENPLSGQSAVNDQIKDSSTRTDAKDGSSITSSIGYRERLIHVSQGEGSVEHRIVRESQQNQLMSMEFHEEDPRSSNPALIGPTENHDMLINRRRSSRLNSLSQHTFKSGFRGGTLANDNNRNQITPRRLSSISSETKKQLRSVQIDENDVNLQALKKRRLSTRSSKVTTTSRTQGRISIISKIGGTPISEIAKSSKDRLKKTRTPIDGIAKINTLKKSRGHHENPDTDRDNITKEQSLDTSPFESTDSLYKNYTIKTVKEIPRHITAEDSAKYTIDEESFTMAELCKPTLPIGELSENFERAKSASVKKLLRRRDRSLLRKRARMEFRSIKSLTKEEEEQEAARRKRLADELLNSDVGDSQQHKDTQGIQLRLDQEGKLVIDEDSMVMDRHKRAQMENSAKDKLDENPFENLYNSATYGRHSYTDPWTQEEIIKFYKALSMWGTDFNLIAEMFPYRTRKQVKAKFNSEEKRHPMVVEIALRSKLPPNFEQYCADIRKNFDTIDDFERKLQDLQEKHESHLREIEEAKRTAKLEDVQVHLSDQRHKTEKKGSGGLKTGQLQDYRRTEVVLGTIDDLKRKKEAEEEEAEQSATLAT